MRKLILFALFAPMLWATSCQKQHDNTISKIQESTDPDVNKHNIMANAKMLSEYTIEDLQGYSPDMQRDIFNEMTPQDRARIWIERLDQYIHDEPNTELGSRAAQLKSLINPALYDEGGDVAPIDAWVENNMTAYGYNKMRGLVTTFECLTVTGGGGTFGGGGPSVPVPTAGCGCKLVIGV